MLPRIFTVLNDATEQVKEKSCYALEAFCENLGDDIVPFLEPLLSRLSELLKVGSRKTQEMCVSAIASVVALVGTVASTLPEDGAPSATLDHLKARAAPTHPRRAA